MAADNIPSTWVFFIDVEFHCNICLTNIVIKGILYQKMKPLSYYKCKNTGKYFIALIMLSDICTGKSQSRTTLN